jgi:glutathione S-transferase
VILRWALSRKVEIRGLDNLARFAERMCADPGVRAAVFAEEGRPADLSPFLAIEEAASMS